MVVVVENVGGGRECGGCGEVCWGVGECMG